MNKIFITCALPYANGPTHLGHLRSTYIPADIYARYNRMKNRDVLFVCATDEHGTPIAVKAEKESKEPIEVATYYYKMIRRDLEACDISFDNFSRTSNPLHHRIAQNFFLKLYEKDFIYEKDIKQFYCSECQRFLPDRYVEGECPYCGAEDARGDHCEACGRHLEPLQLIKPKCMICGSEPKVKKSRHYFFRLSKFQDRILEWIKNNEKLPANVKNYALQWVREGLKDWILTRDMEWGIPVPLKEAKGKIIYVWGEAFLGYISSAVEWSEKTGQNWKEYWDDTVVHFIGKDIIYHHAIFWPALLMAYGCKLPDNIIAGEYLSLEGKKMSTSKNWVVWTSEFLESFESDILRYYLTINAPLTRDTDFSWDDFQRRVNDELADILGNFLHRTFSFTNRFFNGQIPEADDLKDEDLQILEDMKNVKEDIEGAIEGFNFREGLVKIIGLAKKGNKYFNDQEPWKNIKEDPDRAAACIFICNQLAKAIGVFLIPYMPRKSNEILKILNLEENPSWDDATMPVEAGHKIRKAKPLFAKIQDKIIEEEKRKLHQKTKTREVTIDDFARLDLRVGKIIEASKVKGSDKLLKLKVDLNDKTIQVVAGIGSKYQASELPGKKVIILANIKPTRLFGIKSEGMILATAEKMGLLTVEDGEIGEKIK
ncbi:MAG TPA: methionine--tRNA ligase [Methanothermobacter sp.]|nr:methionine--tRNA ligase [Methanothermobacter sp. MT-2]HHW05069.1 methionine--tRNA ligase [Methanothermobacter sp.]HOK72575.1 methionine--tRNA ligase [Methanothermobacter sp.]HOL69362.1 methionine--tRNA ligase [Methanothermobacter sp.]HPQ04062.1 methionine--tRNA ligase [Methanothermobacter sp.]